MLEIEERFKVQKWCLTAICSCFDELISALHLSRHNYFGQSNTHLRSILETLDRVELFNKYPEMSKYGMEMMRGPYINEVEAECQKKDW